MSVTMDLGKVGVLYKGEHDSTQIYERNDIVMSNGSGYVAKQNVPVGIDISNSSYWGTIVVGADSNVFATKAYMEAYTANTYATIADVSALQAAVGSPLIANAVADMTDTEKVYVYTGSETGYTSGNWYYYNGSAWVSGGVYNSTAFETDKTLSVSDMAADAKATGDAIDAEALSREIAVLANKQGFYDYVHLNWESGSINYPGGSDKNPDVNVIRTPLPRIQLSGNIKFILLNNKYRIRYYTFPDASSGGTAQSSWYNAVGTYSITIDKTKYYRIQIATYQAALMNVEDALKSILVVYEADSINYATTEEVGIVKATMPYEWESGSIIYNNGNNIASTSSIRTKDRRYYATNFHVHVKDSNLRVRAFYYLANGTFDHRFEWIPTTKPEGIVPIDTAKLCRFEIATVDDSDIDAESALKNVIFEPVPTLSYWQDYLDTKIATINEYMTDGTDKTAFLFLTDTHYNGNPTQLNSYGINTELMKYVSDKTNIKYCIHGGDLNSEYRSDKAIARILMTEPMAMMRDAFEHVFVTRGNHDDNNESGNKNWSYTISQADSYSYMFRNTKDVVFGETGTYFYHDIPFEKVRIISLDGVDFPYTNDVDSTLLDEKLLAYGYTQLQWLCDTLASAPSGYSIVIYTHEMIAPSAVTIDYPSTSPQTRAKNYAVLANILKAYKNKQNYSESISGSFSTYHSAYYTGTLTGDFTSANASIVGVFSGHEHIDCIEEILDGNGNGIGIYNTCTQNSSALFGDSVISHSYQHPMVIGTTTEIVWDAVVIDRANKHVDMIRIGAYEANTDVDAVTVRSFDYV